jgi:predicted AlkP superfamily pyrophosphatase or phosphodiesterase
MTFLLDHISPDEFFAIVDSGEAPHVTKYILGNRQADGTYSNAAISRQFAAAFPSTSANSHPCLMTGCYGGKNKLFVGNYWNMLGEKPVYTNTDKLTLNGFKKYYREYLNPTTKTLFEHIPHSVSYHVFNRGAEYKLFSIGRIATDFIPLFIKMNKEKEPGHIPPIANPELWTTLFNKHIGKMLQHVKVTGDLYHATFVAFLLTDQNGHKFGFGSPEYRKAVHVMDDCIRMMVEGTTDTKGNHIEGLKELGFLDKIIWCLFSDHAGRPIPKDKYIMIDTVLEGDLGLEIVEGDDAAADLERLNGKLKDADMFSSLASELMCYWSVPDFDRPIKAYDFTPFYGETHFRHMHPKNRMNRKRSAEVDLIEYLRKKEWVQFILVPEESPPQVQQKSANLAQRTKLRIPREYCIKIFGKQGTGLLERKFISNSIHYAYKIIEGKDPLEYDHLNFKAGEWYSHTETLKRTISHDLPDVFHRLFGFFDAINAPNLAVTSSYEYHYWSRKTVHQNEIRNVQTHGGFFRIESIIPAIFAGPGIKKGIEIPFGRNINILPTLLTTMNVAYDPELLDGEPIIDILDR